MILEDFPQLQKLDDRTKLELAPELIESITDPNCRPLSEEELHHVLEERWARYKADPSIALSMEEFEKLMDRERGC